MGESRVIVTCMKNECPYILEWIAYHLEIGFTHFVVATNGCSDGTVRLLRNLERAGIVTQVDNPPPHRRGPQKTGYFRCRDVPAVQKADWLMTLDADEFVNVYAGAGKLDDLFEAMDGVTPGANMVSLQWLMFGHSGIASFEDRPVIEQFTKSAHPRQFLPTLLRSFKTLYRSGLYQKLGTHRPNQVNEAREASIVWTDGSGYRMPDHYIPRGWAGELNGDGLGISLGRINHYAVRSIDAFTIKRDRGDVNPARHHAKMQGDGLSYWDLHDWNEVEDRRIMRHLPAVRDRMAELKTIGRVGELHDVGVAWHLRKAAELARRPDMMALRTALMKRSALPGRVDPSWIRSPEQATA